MGQFACAWMSLSASQLMKEAMLIDTVFTLWVCGSESQKGVRHTWCSQDIAPVFSIKPTQILLVVRNDIYLFNSLQQSTLPNLFVYCTCDPVLWPSHLAWDSYKNIYIYIYFFTCYTSCLQGILVHYLIIVLWRKWWTYPTSMTNYHWESTVIKYYIQSHELSLTKFRTFLKHGYYP